MNLNHGFSAVSSKPRVSIVCALLGLLVVLPGLAHAHWVYTDQLVPGNDDHTFLMHGNIEAYVTLETFATFEGAGGAIVNTVPGDELWMGIRVKCVGHDVSDWVYKFKSASEQNGSSANYNCPDGTDAEWAQGALWAQD